jgi:16S rRNA (guanine966-N2)-methyltransferase
VIQEDAPFETLSECSSMRIISGKFRSRKLFSPPTASTRPTSDRARESIFNIINSLSDGFFTGASVLDAFAGSGTLGLEALSRGADHVTFMEKDPQTARTIKENIANLSVESQCTVIVGDATKLPKAFQPMKLVFLDPPYDQIVGETIIPTLHNQGWLNVQTLIVLETSAKRVVNLPPHVTIIDQRRYGAALISFLKLSYE